MRPKAWAPNPVSPQSGVIAVEEVREAIYEDTARGAETVEFYQKQPIKIKRQLPVLSRQVTQKLLDEDFESYVLEKDDDNDKEEHES